MSQVAAPRAQMSLASVLVRVCRESGIGVERLRAEQLIRDAREAWPGEECDRWQRWLREASQSVALRSRVAELPLRDALQLAQDGALVVGGCSDEGQVTVLVDQTGQSATVACGEIDERRKMSINDLVAQLGEPVDESGRYQWLIVEHPEVSDANDSKQLHQKPVRRFVEILKPEWPDIWMILVFAFFAGVLTLSTPIAVEALVNFVAFGQLLQPVLILAAMLFGFLAFAAIMQAMQTYVAEIIQQRLFARVAADLSYRLPRVDRKSMGHEFGPELVNRFFDIVTLQKVTAQLLLDGIAIVLATLVGMSVLAFYHPWLLGFDILLLLAIVGGLYALGRGGISSGIYESKTKYMMGAWLEDLIRCTAGFKTEGGGEFAIDRANSLTAKYLKARKQHFRVLYRQLVYILGLQVVAGTVLLGGGGWLVIQNQLTLGQLVAAELIVSTILGSLAKLFKHLEGFYDVVAAVDKLGVLFDLKVERHDGIMTLPPGQGIEVNISKVKLNDAGPALAHGLTTTIERGETVAIVGPRGSGKSRLLEILFGIEQPDSGHLQIEKCDPRDLRPDVLRAHVSLAADIEVFDGTIAENIDLRRPGTSPNEVRAALEGVGLLDEVLRLKKGLETHLNGSGKPLSKSQQRLLMLARAMVGQPRMLLIDGLLDSLPDDDLDRVIAYLHDEAHDWTLVVATGRRSIASRFSRWIDLSENEPKMHRASLGPKGVRA
jgi:ABC-type bacteriocin/lantibiotic exporter with double-glycine peptidase domain